MLPLGSEWKKLEFGYENISYGISYNEWCVCELVSSRWPLFSMVTPTMLFNHRGVHFRSYIFSVFVIWMYVLTLVQPLSRSQKVFWMSLHLFIFIFYKCLNWGLWLTLEVTHFIQWHKIHIFFPSFLLNLSWKRQFLWGCESHVTMFCFAIFIFLILAIVFRFQNSLSC